MKTSTPQYFDSTGRPVALGAPLAAGGEGAVYASTQRGDWVVKVYHPGDDFRRKARDAKLAAMVAMPSLRAYPLLAWPQELLYTAGGHVGGYAMRRVGGVTLVALTSPALMRRRLPGWGLRHVVRVVHDLASIFHQLETHGEGVFVPDLNLSNFILTPQTEVVGIDCDSYTVRSRGRIYPSRVFTSDLQAPEVLTGRVPLDEFGVPQFRFAGALLLFALLTGGSPYSTRDGLSVPEAILARRCFLGGRGTATGCSNDAIWQRYRALPPRLAALCKRAFLAGHSEDLATRPSFSEWRSAARSFFEQLNSTPTTR